MFGVHNQTTEFITMAKTPTPPKAPEAPAAAPTPFAVSFGGPPEVVHAVGRGGGEESALMKAIRALPAMANGQYARFFFPAKEIPASIVDPGEREKATVEEVKRALNSASGAKRRVEKEIGSVARFAVRRANVGGVAGVEVFRIEDGTASA